MAEFAHKMRTPDRDEAIYDFDEIYYVLYGLYEDIKSGNLQRVEWTLVGIADNAFKIAVQGTQMKPVERVAPGCDDLPDLLPTFATWMYNCVEDGFMPIGKRTRIGGIIVILLGAVNEVRKTNKVTEFQLGCAKLAVTCMFALEYVKAKAESKQNIE